MASNAATASSEVKVVSWKDYVEQKYNNYVKWVSKHTFNGVERQFSLKLANPVNPDDKVDGTMKKVGRVFLALLSSIVLLPLAAVHAGFSSVKGFLCGPSKGKEEQPNAPNSDKADKVGTTAESPARPSLRTGATGATPTVVETDYKVVDGQ